MSVKVFIGYAHEDQKLREELEKHLSPLERSGKISIWQDQMLLPGENWDGSIQARLQAADLILLLVSASFFASDYGWDRELQKALQRHKAGTAKVIPVILRPTLWKNTPLGQLQALPTGARPVTQWNNQDAAFEDIVRGIQRVVEDFPLQGVPRRNPSRSSSSSPVSSGRLRNISPLTRRVKTTRRRVIMLLAALGVSATGAGIAWSTILHRQDKSTSILTPSRSSPTLLT